MVVGKLNPRPGIHVAHIRLELMAAVLAASCEFYKLSLVHDAFDAPRNIVMLQKNPSFSIVRIIAAIPPWQADLPVCN